MTLSARSLLVDGVPRRVLLVEPEGTAAATATVLLTEPSVGAIAIDGSSEQFLGATGQAGRFVFDSFVCDHYTLEAPDGLRLERP